MRGSKKIALLGFGFEGRALFSYLKKERAVSLTILDKNPKTIIPRGAGAILGKNYLKKLGDFDLIFRSPGVPYNLPEIQKVSRKVSSLTGLFFSKAKGTIVGVTGSAGKTTATTLLFRILKKAGKDVYLAGNIGINSLSLLKKLRAHSIVVVELSSFQLQDLNLSPKVAVILDIYEEHLDKHKNFEEYLRAKGNITRFQKKSDAVIFNLDNKYSKKLAGLSRGRKISYSLFDSNSDLFLKDLLLVNRSGKKLISIEKIKLRGLHNIKNIMAASLAARTLGVSPKIIGQVINNFSGIEHRLEFVREVRGVKFYNDSKATNVGSAIAGIDAFPGNKIVLSGGYNKNLNLEPLARRLARPDVRGAVLFGRARFELAGHLKKLGSKKYSLKKGLLEALRAGFRQAKRGDVVLLEPGTASFDEFRDYQERGDLYKKAVRALK